MLQKRIKNAGINNYVTTNFTKKELEKVENNSYLIFSDDKIAGYSKIVINSKNENITPKSITILSRLYLLKEFYGYQFY